MLVHNVIACNLFAEAVWINTDHNTCFCRQDMQKRWLVFGKRLQMKLNAMKLKAMNMLIVDVNTVQVLIVVFVV